MWVKDQQELGGLCVRLRVALAWGSHLLVTSIWMMKLEKKTRKVQAA